MGLWEAGKRPSACTFGAIVYAATDSLIDSPNASFEEAVSRLEQRLYLFEIECLQITAYVEKRMPVIISECLDLAASSKVIVDAVAFARSGIAGVIKDHGLKPRGQVRIEFPKRLGKWTFASAGRASQDHETPIR